MFLTEYYVAFKQMSVALHLCLNCVYVGYRQTWIQLKEWDGWSLGRAEKPREEVGQLAQPLPPQPKRKNWNQACQAVVITTTLTISGIKQCNKAQTMPALCSGAAVEDNSSVALFINCDTKAFGCSHWRPAQEQGIIVKVCLFDRIIRCEGYEQGPLKSFPSCHVWLPCSDQKQACGDKLPSPEWIPWGLRFTYSGLLRLLY